MTINLKQQEFITIIDELNITDQPIGKKSELLKRIEELSPNHSMHGDHDKHCHFDRDGGGHVNVCWSNDDNVELIPKATPMPSEE